MGIDRTPDFDFGHGVTGYLFVNKDGHEQGIIEAHTNAATGGHCQGAVFWDRTGSLNERPIWQLVSREPLTLTPSILCRECGNHGFITAGKWVPA